MHEPAASSIENTDGDAQRLSKEQHVSAQKKANSEAFIAHYHMTVAQADALVERLTKFGEFRLHRSLFTGNRLAEGQQKYKKHKPMSAGSDTYLCRRRGKPSARGSNGVISRIRASIRCGCKASFIIKYDQPYSHSPDHRLNAAEYGGTMCRLKLSWSHNHQVQNNTSATSGIEISDLGLSAFEQYLSDRKPIDTLGQTDVNTYMENQMAIFGAGSDAMQSAELSVKKSLLRQSFIRQFRALSTLTPEHQHIYIDCVVSGMNEGKRRIETPRFTQKHQLPETND